MKKDIKYSVEVKDGYAFKGVGGLVIRTIHPEVNGSDQLGMGVVYMYPGEELPPHSHFNEEAYFILSGEGYMTVDDEEIELKKNLSVYMPAESVHYTKNTGNEPLIFICALSPAPVAK
ncbi:dimethylsulfonioproprionate lyase family protein [Anaerosalibacter massiliensis]|uniref:dimethylsulfonioproprionate lyase family protein n=1 Tax=Anaerosalibacter massiliensis TaxID=1347392 RepID=UPI0006790B22|nr:dimethylsulfonioproprionate lyase family protein [Anaerosalibacter massiliensis]